VREKPGDQVIVLLSPTGGEGRAEGGVFGGN